MYAASSTQTIALTLAGVAPGLTLASNSLSVKEDRTVALGIGETPFDQVMIIDDHRCSLGREPVGGNQQRQRHLDAHAGAALRPHADGQQYDYAREAEADAGRPAPVLKLVADEDPIAPMMKPETSSRSVSAGGMVRSASA